MGDRLRQDFLDTIIEGMSDRDIRHLVVYMDSTEQDIFSFDELVDELLSVHDGSNDGYQDSRKDISIYCHHRHLPKIEAMGLIEYDVATRTVQYRGIPDCDISGKVHEMDSVEDSGLGLL